METSWRLEVLEDVRKQLITEMYHELVRISGENDAHKVWSSAAKFELRLWTSSADRTTYLTMMQRKVLSLRRKPQFGQPPAQPGAAVAPQQQQNVMATDHALHMNGNATVGEPGVAPSQQQQVQSVPVTCATQVSIKEQAQPPAPQASAVSTSIEAISSQTGATNVLTPQQQQAQQWLQRLQAQFHAQQQQALRVQHQEAEQLRRQQLIQQQQLSQQHQQQRVPADQRRLLMQQLQQQHELVRSHLQHRHKSQQQQLQHKQQQYLLQKQQQLQIQTGLPPLPPLDPKALGTIKSETAEPSQIMSQQQPAIALQPKHQNALVDAAATSPVIKPERLQVAHAQQARLRDLQRAKNTTDLEQSALEHAKLSVVSPQQRLVQMQPVQGQAQARALVQAESKAQCPAQTQAQMSAPASAPSQPPSAGQATSAASTDSSERLLKLRTKYWNDLVLVYKELERMVKEQSGSQQVARVNHLLVTLRQIIALLAQDPSKSKPSSKESLDRVEAHLQSQVLPILHRLREKARLSGDLPSGGAAGRAAVADVNSNEGAAAALAAHKAQQEMLKKQQEAQLEEQQEAHRRRQVQLQEQQKLLDAQRDEQQRTLQEEEKKGVADPAAAPASLVPNEPKLKPEVHKVGAAGSLAKAQRVTVATAASAVLPAISENKTGPTLTPTPTVVALVETPVVGAPTSVVPDLTGLSPSEKLLTAVSAFEKNKSDVLRRSSARFSRIAVAIGAKLCTAYEVSGEAGASSLWSSST